MENNPDLDGIIKINAPWHNKQNCRFPANSPRTFLEGLLYVLISKESQFLCKQKYTHGIDVLGSRQGSWLLRRGRIPHRFGVRGYAGGDKTCEKCVDFVENCKVAESALAFLPFLAAKKSGTKTHFYLLTKLSLKKQKEIGAKQPQAQGGSSSLRGQAFPRNLWGTIVSLN